MKKKTQTLLVRSQTWLAGVLALGGGLASCAAPDTADAPEPALSHHAGGLASDPYPLNPTHVDLDPSGTPQVAWPGISSYEGRNWLLGAPTDARDLTLQWQAAWDAQNLYLRINTSDLRPALADSPYAWEDDSIEIYIDADGSGGTRYDGQNDFQFVFRVGRPGSPSFGVNSVQDAAGVDASFFSHRYAGYAYRADVVIPWSTLGVVPVAGQRFGLDVHANDDDDGGARDRKLATFATADDAWTNPSSFGSFVISDLPSGNITRVVPAPLIDGTPLTQEWGASTVRQAERLLLGTRTGADDLSLGWRATWNEAALYVLAYVTDQAAVSDSAYPWEDDSLELYIDGNGSGGESYTGPDDAQYVFRPGEARVHVGARSLASTDGVQFAFQSYGGGYVFEAAVPWTALGVVPKAGAPFGLDVHVNDDDDGGVRDAKLATFARTDDAWTRPASFGRGTLSDYGW